MVFSIANAIAVAVTATLSNIGSMVCIMILWEKTQSFAIVGVVFVFFLFCISAEVRIFMRGAQS